MAFKEIGMSGFGSLKHPNFNFLIPIFLLSSILCDFLGSPKKTRRREFDRKEFELGLETLAS